MDHLDAFHRHGGLGNLRLTQGLGEWNNGHFSFLAVARLLEGLLQTALEVVQDFLGLFHSQLAAVHQAFRVELSHGATLLDFLIHERLSKGRVVDLLVAVPAVADEVDHDVLAELSAVLVSQASNPHARLRIVAVHVKDRSLHHLGDVRGVRAGPRLRRRRGEADVVVHHDMDRATCLVAGQLRHVEAFRHHTLAGESRITVDQKRKDSFLTLFADEVLLGAGHTFDHRIDGLEV